MTAEEKVSWNDVKEKYLKFHGMDEFTENMAIDIDFGYWLANEVITEALRWRDVEVELPINEQEILCKNEVYKAVHWYYEDGKFDADALKSEFTHWRPIK